MIGLDVRWPWYICIRLIQRSFFRTAANAKKYQTCDVSSNSKGGCGGGGGGGDENKQDIEGIVSKLLVGVAPNLIWVTQRNKIDWKRLRKDQV